MMKRLCLVAVLAVVARAEEEQLRKPGPEQARKYFAELQAAEKAGQALTEEASKKTQAAKSDEEKAAARKEWMDAYKKAEALKAEPTKTFREVFAVTDWNFYDVKTDAELLETGLNEVGRHALESDPALAVRAFEMLVTKLPDAPSAQWARTSWLPIALPSTGDLDGAEKRLTELAAAAKDVEKPDLLMAVGDVKAIKGDAEGAQAAYADALKAIPEGVDPKNDARGRAKGYLEMRAALIGKPAPEIDAKTWLGGEAKPLSKLQGGLVLLDFWATWCGPCIESIPGVEGLVKDFGDKGLTVLGVTKFYKNGFLPKDRAELLKHGMKDGDSVQGLDEAAFLKHIETFRERCKVGFPSVIGGDDDFKNYRIRGIPTVFLIDRKGNVAFVAVGGMKERLLRIAIERRLVEK